MSSFLARLGLIGGIVAAALIFAAPHAAILVIEIALSLLALFGVAAALWALRDGVLYARRTRAAGVVVGQDELGRAFDRLRRQVELGTSSAADFHLFVEPLLAQIATRLLLRHGVDVVADADQARRLLGSDLSVIAGLGDGTALHGSRQELRVRLSSAVSSLEQL